MRLLQRIVEKPRTCAYLPEQGASLEVLVMVEVMPQELERLLERGYRRFGPCYFRPKCAACGECISLRVLPASFEPSRTQKRVQKKAANLRRVVSQPCVTESRLALYNKWHNFREEIRGWPSNPVDVERYAFDFAFPHPSAREATFYDGDRLIGVGIFDETPSALSATFFFYDPEYASMSLGAVNVLALIADAQAKGKSFVYLGYRVAGCRSLEYKANFRPHEVLVGRPGDQESPLWRAP